MHSGDHRNLIVGAILAIGIGGIAMTPLHYPMDVKQHSLIGALEENAIVGRIVRCCKSNWKRP